MTLLTSDSWTTCVMPAISSTPLPKISLPSPPPNVVGSSPAAAPPRPGTARQLAKALVELQAATCLVELLADNATRPSLAAHGQWLVDSIARQFAGSRVALGIFDPGNQRVELLAVANTVGFDRRSELVLAIETLMTEHAQPTNSPTPPAESCETPATPVQQIIQAAWRAERILPAPLLATADRPVAVLLCADTPLDAERELLPTFLSQATRRLGQRVEAWQQSSLTRVQKLTQHGRRRLRSVAMPLALLLLAALVVVPAPNHVRCLGRIEPVTRRFVAAPFEGPLERSLVRPGEMVEQGQLLGRMDDKELRLRLPAIAAQIRQASKSRDVNMALGNTAAAQIDALEIQRLEQEAELLRQRQQRLEIRSPLAGVVLSGDLVRHEGATVQLGQSLFEIAPLESLLVELAIPEERVRDIAVGTSVTLFFDSLATERQVGTIQLIRPRAELRDNAAVFIAEVLVNNADQRLRPGMQATAHVASDHASLAWQWLNRPWHVVRSRMGW